MSDTRITESPLDSNVVNQLRALQRPGEPDMLRQLADIYVEDASKSLRTLHESLNTADSKLLFQTAHTLKSSSASLGALRLSSIFEKLERIGRSDTLYGAGDLLVAAEVEFTAVCTALRAQSAAPDVGARTAADYRPRNA